MSPEPIQDRVCPRCSGSGRIQAPSPRTILDWRGGDRYEVVGCSATIFESCDAAKHIAASKKAVVCFDFLGIEVVVEPASSPEAVAREWWVKKYGETLEASHARR